MTNLAGLGLLLPFLPIVAACDAGDSGGSELAGRFVLAGSRGDDCDDLHCPMADESRAAIGIHALEVDDLTHQPGLIMSSSNEAVLRVERGSLRDGIQGWQQWALEPGEVDLIVTDVDGAELLRTPIVVEEAAGLGAEAISAAVEMGQASGPAREAGVETWTIEPDAWIPFMAIPTRANGERMMGDFRGYLFETLPPGLSFSRNGSPFFSLAAVEPATYPVAVRAIGGVAIRTSILFVAE